MVEHKKLSGNWKGRIVDIQGFEGELDLSIKVKGKGQVYGSYEITIGTNHSSMKQQGELTGSCGKRTLQLVFGCKQPAVKVKIKAGALALRDGGLGLTGIYKVSARDFSPLQGGVMSVSKDRANADEVLDRKMYG